MNKKQQIRRAHLILSTFKSLNDKQTKEFVKYLSDDAIEILSECLHNVLKTPLNLTKSQRKKITLTFDKHLPLIKKLAKPQTNIKYKRRAFQQRGSGIITTLAATIIPALIGLLSKK